MHLHSLQQVLIFDEWEIKQAVEEGKQPGMSVCLPLTVAIPEATQRENTWNPACLDVQTPAQTKTGRKHTNLHVQRGQSWSTGTRWWLTCLFSAVRGHSAVGAHIEPELLPQRGHGEDSSALPVWYPAPASPLDLKANKGTTQRTTSSRRKQSLKEMSD